MNTSIKTVLVILFFTNVVTAQQPQNPPVITKPDLTCHIRQSGEKLIITVDNEVTPNPNNGSGKAPRSKAELKMGTQPVQVIAVPELKPQEKHEQIIPIPANLLNQAFTATLKVDVNNSVQESLENNNVFTKKFNECDLVTVKNAIGTLDMSWDEKNKPGIFRFKVKNDGARQSPVSVALVRIIETGKSPMLQNVSIPAISPGATVTLEFKFAGKICKTYFQVECDPGMRLAESNEGNNIAFIKPTCE